MQRLLVEKKTKLIPMKKRPIKLAALLQMVFVQNSKKQWMHMKHFTENTVTS